MRTSQDREMDCLRMCVCGGAEGRGPPKLRAEGAGRERESGGGRSKECEGVPSLSLLPFPVVLRPLSSSSPVMFQALRRAVPAGLRRLSTSTAARGGGAHVSVYA